LGATKGLKTLSELSNPARVLKEAYDQGGVLSFSTVGLLTGLQSPNAISHAVARFYAQNPDVVLPHSGTIFDWVVP
jgi:hypothetical protein